MFSWVGVLLPSYLLCSPELPVREAALSFFAVFCSFMSKIQDGRRVPAFLILCAPPYRARRITRVPCSFPTPCDSDRERTASLSLLVLPHNSLLTAEIVLTSLESILLSAHSGSPWGRRHLIPAWTCTRTPGQGLLSPPPSALPPTCLLSCPVPSAPQPQDPERKQPPQGESWKSA